MADTITISTATERDVVKVVERGPQGPAGAAGTGLDTLTSKGDTLYRGETSGERLPIGTTGQILKVSASGLPEWGASPATGVTSVALASSDLTISGSPITTSGTITANLSNSGATAGTYTKVTVDAKGRVTAGAAATAADVGAAATAHTHVAADLTDLQTNGNAAGLWDSVNDQQLVSAGDGELQIRKTGTALSGALNASVLSANQGYNLPDASGTLALTTTVVDNAAGLYDSANSVTGLTVSDYELSITNGTNVSSLTFPVGASRNYTLPNASGTIALTGHTHAASDITSGTIDTARLATSGTANSGTFLRGDQTWAAVSGVTTGSVDNAIIRADGTGGSTSQSSDINIEDATTSTANNVTISNQHSGQTNSSLVLSPKGTGSLSASKPNGAASGGNARGANATDWQTLRTAATQVASGTGSVIIGGDRNTSSNTCTIAGGENAIASSTYAIALGRSNTAQTGAACAVVGGQSNSATGGEAFVMGGGTNRASGNSAAVLCGDYGLADRAGLLAQGNGRFAADGDAQWIHIVLRAKTTTNSAVELLINNLRTTNGRLTCPSGKIISGIINIHGVKSDGTASAHFVRQFQVKNQGGTSSYPYAAVTIGTDYASSTSITFNDPDTNGDALSVSVTGIASETWRWTAHVSAVETAYGT